MKQYSVDIDKLNTVLGGKVNVCPVCQARGSLSVLPKVMELREYQGGSLVVGGQNAIAPVIVLMCSKCGNMIMLNALINNLLKETEITSDEPTD